MIAIAASLLFASSSFAALPDWSKPAAKLAAYDQFVDLMKEGPAYVIKAVGVTEEKIDSGQDAVVVRIDFDDSKGCWNRYLRAQCVPLDDRALFCFMGLTGCREEDGWAATVTVSRAP
jgi:hypothetical protein